MEAHGGVYEQLGQLLTYPGEDHSKWVNLCRESAENTNPVAAQRIERFSAETHGLTIERLQELYTHTFDLSPVCSLEIGWQLYGEEYTRGSFMVTVRQQLRRHGIPESIELPDHLTNVLPLLGSLEESEAREFSTTFLLPALTKMLPAFAGKDCPYEHVLQALDGLLRARYGSVAAEDDRDEAPRRFATGDPEWDPRDLVQITTDSQRGLE